MSVVEFTIGNQTHQIACEDGEEQHIQRLAQNVNQRIQSLNQNFKSASESLVTAITIIMMEDEISSLKEKLEELAVAKVQAYEANPSTPGYSQEDMNFALAEIYEEIADKLETLAKRFTTQ